MNMMTSRKPGAVWRRVRAPYLGPDNRRDLQRLPIPVRSPERPVATEPSRFAAAISNPDFVAIAIFCAIGLLATVNLMLRIPNIGIM